MLGPQLARLPFLERMLQEHSKHGSKMSRGTLGRGAEDLFSWLQSIPDLCNYADMFKEAGATGEELAAVETDTELIDLGMQREIDRKFMLLQLARVRAAPQHWR